MIVFIEFKAKRIFRSLEKKVEICSLNFFPNFQLATPGFRKKREEEEGNEEGTLILEPLNKFIESAPVCQTYLSRSFCPAIERDDVNFQANSRFLVLSPSICNFVCFLGAFGDTIYVFKGCATADL